MREIARAQAAQKKAREQLKRQRKRERAALKKLRDLKLTKSGRYNPKRKTYYRALFDKFRDVLEGKATVVKPKDAKTYKRQFRVVGDRVVVPRRKGDRVTVKEGKIRVSRKRGRRRETGTVRPVAEVSPGKIYVLPLARQDGIEWHRFKSREDLNAFIYQTSPKIGQTFKNVADYVLEIDDDDIPEDEEESDFFEEALRRQLNRRYRARRKRRKAVKRKRRL